MADISSIEHDPPPSPREKERLIWLSFAIAAPPALWIAQLLILSSFTNYTCYPGDILLGQEPPGMAWVHGLIIAFDVAAIVLTIAAGWVAFGYHRLARERLNRCHDALSIWHLDRLRFMAMGGMLSGSGFLVAIIFETIASLMVTPCAG